MLERCKKCKEFEKSYPCALETFMDTIAFICTVVGFVIFLLGSLLLSGICFITVISYFFLKEVVKKILYNKRKKEKGD